MTTLHSELGPLGVTHSRALRSLARLALRAPRLVDRLAAKRSASKDGRQLDPVCAAVLAFDDFDRRPDWRRMTPAAGRRRMAIQIAAADEAIPTSLATRELSLRTESGRAIPARLYVPNGVADGSPGVVFYHGGGFVCGGVSTHDGFCRRAAIAIGARIVSVDYRLAPEHPFPAATEDALDGFRAVGRVAGELGIDPSRLAVMGDSAGGNLAAVVSLMTRLDPIKPVLQVLLYPATELTRSFPSHQTLSKDYFLTTEVMDWFMDAYLGVGRAAVRHPNASPYFADGLEGAPPAYVVTAGFDPLRDEGAGYAKRLEEAGIAVKVREARSLVHGFVMMGGIVPSAAVETQAVLEDVRALLKIGQ